MKILIKTLADRAAGCDAGLFIRLVEGEYINSGARRSLRNVLNTE
jgi:hypothetical protein